MNNVTDSNANLSSLAKVGEPVEPRLSSDNSGTAASTLDNWRLDGCTLYVTLEPCPMCAGAILNSRVSRIVYGSPDSRFGGCGTTIDVITGNALKRAVEVTGGILADECLGLLKGFFQQMRLEKGDTGAKPQTP